MPDGRPFASRRGQLALLAILLPLAAAVPVRRQGGRAEGVTDGRGNHARTFAVQNDTFVRDGIPLQIVSGELHYFRVPRDLWLDRLLRLKFLGFNTVQTYVAWNYHEPDEGSVSFSGERDVEAFVALAHELGLMVLLRPGPYICAEWEFGGLPAWLLADERVRLRTFEATYIAAVSRWWKLLLSRMRKYLYGNGGPIIAVQIENEFGQFGDVTQNRDDWRYMRHLVRLARQTLGTSVVLYTTDFGNLENMRRGSLPGLQKSPPPPMKDWSPQPRVTQSHSIFNSNRQHTHERAPYHPS